MLEGIADRYGPVGSGEGAANEAQPNTSEKSLTPPLTRLHPRIAFVHNFATHYTVGTFELLARRNPVHFYFFSAGNEWFWLPEHGVMSGSFRHEYLRGFGVGRTKIVPGLPIRLLRGNYEIVVKCINGRFALPVTYLVAKVKHTPFILWTGLWFRLGTMFHRIAFPFMRHIYRHADAIVVYGEHVRQYLVREGVSCEKIFVAPHAVRNETYGRVVSEQEKADARRRFGIGAMERVVLFVGRLERVKGLDYLIEAFSRLGHEDVVLAIAGVGSEMPRLRRLAQDRGVQDRVRFLGFVRPEETVALYALSFCLALPSISTPRGKELWGLVVNEAFNQGLPAVTTEAVGAAAGGLVEDRINGLIVPERDADALTVAFRALLNDGNLRCRLGEGALRTIAKWDQGEMVRGFEQAFEYVRARSRSRYLDKAMRVE